MRVRCYVICAAPSLRSLPHRDTDILSLCVARHVSADSITVFSLWAGQSGSIHLMRYGAPAALLSIVFCLLTGCSTAPKVSRTDNTSTLLVLNGIDGPGPWYNPLVNGLRDAHAADDVEMCNWGGSLLLWLNLSSQTIHAQAERNLVKRINQCRELSPNGRITLVGHSAGCGVILGALQRLPENSKVDTVVLLAPCVGKDHDLSTALSHVAGTMHVFYSDRDATLVSTTVTGTYDYAWNGAAGRDGFAGTSQLPADLQAHLQQHPYEADWDKLGHGGGHFGYRKRPFVMAIVAPLVTGDLVQPPTINPAASTNFASVRPHTPGLQSSVSPSQPSGAAAQ